MFSLLKKNNNRLMGPCFCVLAGCLWLGLMSSFLLNKVSLQNDAVSYYDHIKYYVDQIMIGVYPSWDPHWNFGVPNEYFLRRFNGYNPLLLLIVLLRWLGCPHLQAYFSFLVFYFFLGAWGLYGIVKRLTGCPCAAFLAFCLFIFSSMGIKLFESYLILVSVPLLWFFFFLTGLSKKWSRRELLGLVFTMMLLGGTYIPFFAVTIIAGFVLCCCLLYPRRCGHWLAQGGSFAVRHKWFVLIAVLILASSLLPGWFFYQETKQSGFILPGRIMADENSNIFKIQREGVSHWGMIEHLIFSSYFKDPRLLRLNAFFVPLLGLVVMGLGFLVPTTKRLCLFVLWALVVFLAVCPQTGLYEFLYRHVFYYSLYRNLHFYLWFFVLPLGIVTVSEIWCQFISQQNRSRALRILSVGWVLVLFLLIPRFLIPSPQLSRPSLITLLISGLFFLFLAGRKDTLSGPVGGTRALVLYAFILFATFYPARETFAYLAQRAPKLPKLYRYDVYQTSFAYERDRQRSMAIEPEVSYVPYCAMKGVDHFVRQMDPVVWREYLKTKFIVYDRVAQLPEGKNSFRVLKRALLQNRNTAYVSHLAQEATVALKTFFDNAKFLEAADTPLMIKDASPHFQVTRYRADRISFQTQFPQQKFIVYTDAFHQEWRAYLDGKPVPLFQSQLAFKGLLVPPGKHVITLRFLSALDNFFALAMLSVYAVTLTGVIVLHITDRPGRNKTGALSP